ncbi:hypothetical protein GCM10020254_77860 [Streptomyces goshikiensis]
MTAGYAGEPHDGVYALQRYSRRVAVQADARFAATACLDDLARPVAFPRPAGPLLDKAAVEDLNRGVDRGDAELYFRSGGSTGTPALSLFTYDDYDTQMHAAARGLLAAGYDPARDRTANLFYCGGMYGGFISFFSILERLGGVQMPMAAGPDHRATAEMIVAYEVDTLFGMPSYLWQLLHEEGDRLRSYGGLRKIYYGGEHFTEEQRRTLTESFGIEVIHSITYGSTDLGPLGYQCTESGGGVHHLHADLHTMEILDADEDRPRRTGGDGPARLHHPRPPGPAPRPLRHRRPRPRPARPLPLRQPRPALRTARQARRGDAGGDVLPQLPPLRGRRGGTTALRRRDTGRPDRRSRPGGPHPPDGTHPRPRTGRSARGLPRRLPRGAFGRDGEPARLHRRAGGRSGPGAHADERKAAGGGGPQALNRSGSQGT